MLKVTSGLPGSGKTTWALQQDGVKVSRDDLRRFTDDEDEITRMETDIIVRAVRSGQDVVIHNTNLEKRYLNRYVSLAGQLGTTFEIVDHFLDVPHSVLVERASERGGVWPGVLDKFWKRYNHLKPGWFTPPNYPPAHPLKFNTANPVTYIFDVDGTLANSDHRDPYDESLVHKDTLIRPVGEVFWSLFAAGFHIIVLSGRKDTSYKQTKEWIADRTGVPVNGFGLVMRGALDNRPDWLVKFEMLSSLQESDVNVLGVFDDRNSVLRMWETAGVHVFDVSQGKGEF